MPCLLTTSNYFDETETKSTSSASGRERNEDTCTLIHRDITCDLGAGWLCVISITQQRPKRKQKRQAN
jgi:hypothetical protein